MRIGLTLSFFALSFSLFSQDLAEELQDSLSKSFDLETTAKDSLLIKDSIPSQKIDSLKLSDQDLKKKKPPKAKKKKRYRPYIKSMDQITVSDYKILYLDETERSVDTSLSLEAEFTFNFLRKDYFEYLPLPNMGEGFNKMGYDFHDQSFTPQMGARVKHFGYFEKEAVPYYEMPSAYTELFFKTTFQQGQHLDATLAINTSPKLNVAVSFKGFRSLGKYSSSLSRSRQFRMSTQYQTYNHRYRMRLHQTTQSLENDFNGGLSNDGVYFFENAPNYVVVDQSGQPVLNENGEEEFVFYDGFLDRTQLPTQVNGTNILEGKRYFMDHQYRMFPVAKDTTAYKMTLGYRTNYETKNYQISQARIKDYFFESYTNDVIADTTNYNTLENSLYAKFDNSLLGKLNVALHHTQWEYFFGENEYVKDTLVSNRIDANQLATQLDWSKSIFGIQAEAGFYNSLKEDYKTQAWHLALSRPLIKDIRIQASYKDRSQPLNFNFHLFESDYKEYNWNNTDLLNQEFKTKSLELSHPKWGSLSGAWTTIDNYTIFNNTTSLRNLNEKFKVAVLQLDRRIDYFKARFDQRLDFRKFSWINNVQFQEVSQELVTDQLLSGPIALNVPKWLIRSTFMLTSSMFNKALFFQSGATFVFFTDYYADQYNPLLAEFVTQNNTKIGEYPRVDFFFNAKIRSSRLFVKLENVNAPLEHLIFPDTPYDYYAAPFTPYRDFSVRIGLIWNFFE
ncbi:MAG: hypothetical protein P8H87_07815 [Flavobacteriaceae bacterium]|nr:hypothetical protein [Flavobacteriaceae bacterium]